MEESSARRNRIVVRRRDGRLQKGYTHDFTPASDTFHLTDEAGNIREIKCSDLKAVFFVKSLAGNPAYEEKKRFDEVDSSRLRGLKVRVKFFDGEVMRGTSLSYSGARKGFYIIPIDPDSNNERVYVVTDATVEVRVGAGAER